MNIKIIRTIATFFVITSLVGCSPHEDTPKTPTVIGTTPTYRTTANSTDPVHVPYYLTPGANSGQKSALPSLPAPDRYSANNPLAVSVYVTLMHDKSVDAQYVAVEGKANSVWLKGTVSSIEQKTRIEKIAHATLGVKEVKDDLVVQE